MKARNSAAANRELVFRLREKLVSAVSRQLKIYERILDFTKLGDIELTNAIFKVAMLETSVNMLISNTTEIEKIIEE